LIACLSIFGGKFVHSKSKFAIFSR
jgi:hypothetical protein